MQVENSGQKAQAEWPGRPCAWSGEGWPPLANRGVEARLVEPWQRRVDWLTLTLGSEEASELTARYELQDVGNAVKGFRRSERRMVLGGLVWRRWEPYTASRLHGLDYESWEWDGEHAMYAAAEWAGKGRPSRIDVAWDWEVAPHETADGLFNLLRPFVERAGLTIGVSGSEPHLTRYVGAPSSEFRIRIYRKDVQQGELWCGPPTMRFEAQMRDGVARDWWAMWAQNRERAYAMAAGRVEACLGLRVQGEAVTWSEFEEPQQKNDAQLMLACFDQWGDHIAAWHAAGVPVLELIEERPASRSGVARRKQRERRLRANGVPEVVTMVRSVLAARMLSGG